MDFRFESNSALLIIDLLNDFIKEEGSLMVPVAARIVPPIREILDAARNQGVPVVYLTDRHRPDDLEFRHWPSHAVIGTWGAEIIDELKPLPQEYVIPKRRYSAFYGTDLDIYLRELGVRHIYETGVLTNICVYVTAIDASTRLYQVSVFKDAVASLSEETDRFIFQQLEEVIKAELI
jgi:nicotinamidase/pyrazinamidase